MKVNSREQLPLQKLLVIISGHGKPQCLRQAKVDRQTAIDMYQWLRGVCSSTLLHKPIVLGGPGIEVHMDESLFQHKPKVLVINFNYHKKNHSVDCSCIESQRMINRSLSLGVRHN